LEFLPVSDDEFSRELEQRHGECDNRGRPWEYAELFEKSGFTVFDFSPHHMRRKTIWMTFSQGYRYLPRNTLLGIEGR
jgi:hypothetical protein